MRLKKNSIGLILIIIAAIIVLAGAYCLALKAFWLTGDGKSDIVSPLLGGDRDAHGCIGSAGYSWCEVKGKCLRVWEEKCEKAVSTPAEVPADWKTYRNDKYGFEVKYPENWKVEKDKKYPFVQLQEVSDEEVVAIAGGIHIISKPISSSIDSPYAIMYASGLRCPVAAGSRDLSSKSQLEEYIYCLTGKEIQTGAGVWKGAVECSASSWYSLKMNPDSCPHEFWIETKDFFYVVHFNYFQPIVKNSPEEIFFTKFLNSFSFFAKQN